MAPWTGKTIAYGITGHVEFMPAIALEDLWAVIRYECIQLMLMQISHSALSRPAGWISEWIRCLILPYFTGLLKGVLYGWLPLKKNLPISVCYGEVFE